MAWINRAANPTDAWMLHMRLREGLGDWIRRNHPEWWPTDRLLMRRRDQIAGENGGAKKS